MLDKEFIFHVDITTIVRDEGGEVLAKRSGIDATFEQDPGAPEPDVAAQLFAMIFAVDTAERAAQIYAAKTNQTLFYHSARKALQEGKPTTRGAIRVPAHDPDKN